MCDRLSLPLALGYFVMSLRFFGEDLRCHSGVGDGYWRQVPSVLRHCLWDVANQSLVAFLLVSVVEILALVSPWPARLDIPRQHALERHWSLRSSVCLLPSPGCPCGLSVEGECMSPPLNVLFYFLEILDYIYVDSFVYFFSNVSVFLFLQLLASTCLGFLGREGGSTGRRSVFIHQPPWLLILRGSLVRHTRSPSHLSINLLLIPKVSILLEQMKFCFS